MGKINNSFKEEFKSIDDMVKKILFELKVKQKTSKIFWAICAWTIGILNISVLALSGYALFKVIDENDKWGNMLWEVIIISSLSIILFAVTFILSVYQAKMKHKWYWRACQAIQFESILYNSPKNKKTEKEFLKTINEIYKGAHSFNKKVSVKQTAISILTGGEDA